jgi:hypothetical protein
VLLAPEVAAEVTPSRSAAEQTALAVLDVPALGPITVTVAVRPLAIDGVLGSTFTSTRAFAFDLASNAVWASR